MCYIHTTGSIFPYWCFSSCSNSLHLQSPWRSERVFPDTEHNVWDSSPALRLQVCQQARVFYETKTRRKNRIAELCSSSCPWLCIELGWDVTELLKWSPNEACKMCNIAQLCSRTACFVYPAAKGKIKTTAFSTTSHHCDFARQWIASFPQLFLSKLLWQF